MKAIRRLPNGIKVLAEKQGYDGKSTIVLCEWLVAPVDGPPSNRINKEYATWICLENDITIWGHYTKYYAFALEDFNKRS